MKYNFVLIFCSLLSFHSQKAFSEEIPAPKPIQEEVDNGDSLNLLRHNPLYFAYGEPSSKLQLSFKYRLIKKKSLYLAYTQLMFWKLREDSKPFEDLTYNPELLYRWEMENKAPLDAIDFGIWEHNSNGKPGTNSRSFERIYIRTNLSHQYDKWFFKFSAKAAHMFNLDDTNKDIRNHISPYEFRASFQRLFRGALNESELAFRFFPGGKYGGHWSNGGFESSLNFRFLGLSIVPAFYIQYYSGYAESLLNYNQRVNEWRVGFML